jgi:hypothetical protein
MLNGKAHNFSIQLSFFSTSLRSPILDERFSAASQATQAIPLRH